MGSNFAPLLFVYSHEAEFIQNLQNNRKHLVKFFNFTFRYINDVLLLNNPYVSQNLHLPYPSIHEIKDTTDTRRIAIYLDFFPKY